MACLLLAHRHIGKPVYNFPGMIIIPTAIFYCVLFGLGGDLESARRDGWMFTKGEETEFWHHWDNSWGALGEGRIAWEQLPACMAVLAVMLPIVALDVPHPLSLSIAIQPPFIPHRSISLRPTSICPLSSLCFPS